MTARHLVPIDADTLQRIAHHSGRSIEIDSANDRAYLRVNVPTTFVAELEQEVCS